MAEKMFDGFDHTQYKDEVEQRWGKEAYAKSDALVALECRTTRRTASCSRHARAHRQRLDEAAAASGVARDSDEAQALAQRQYDWLSGIPGTPGGRPGSARRRTTSPASARCTSPTTASP